MFPVQEKSPPVQVKKPFSNLDVGTCRLSSCNPEYTKFINAEGVRQYIEIDLKTVNFEIDFWPDLDPSCFSDQDIPYLQFS